MTAIDIVTADLANAAHQDAVVAMLDAYSADPMGDRQPLSAFARENVVDGLRRHPTTLIFLAMQIISQLGSSYVFVDSLRSRLCL